LKKESKKLGTGFVSNFSDKNSKRLILIMNSDISGTVPSLDDDPNMRYCYACNNRLSHAKLGDYAQCPVCHSFTYISDQSAEIENNAYFDEVFRTFDERKDSFWKLKIFQKYDCMDQKKKKLQYNNFNEKYRQIIRHLNKPATVLEIGFGTGDHLYSLLQQGVDAYGIDLSATAVKNFKEKYPQYANVVQCGTRFHRQVDIVYCCALFEHLDQPQQFIQDAARCLRPNGFLIIDGLPILNDGPSDLTIDEDISFWKPCHRVIYSLNGLITLWKSLGFTLEVFASHDSYNYRVMSLHMKDGYHSIIELRSSSIEHRNLPRILNYYRICRKALYARSLVYYGCVLFTKNHENRSSAQ
jgi:SAM-dependent methyltransferase